MSEKVFKLKSKFEPAGDQPKAILELNDGLKKGLKKQTLLGATGTGKTFTMANVILEYNKPTLVIAHNKTLAAQLATEFKEFFPDAAVHYFVSYYDYYQPEAYMPASDTFIEKDAQINKEIDRLRHATTQALLTRKDVIIVASVSCIYGLGSPEEYEKTNLKLNIGTKLDRASLMKKLISMHFERTNADLSSGNFRVVGPKIDLMPVSETFIYSIEFSGTEISRILKIDPISSTLLKEYSKDDTESIYIFPAKHFITEDEKTKVAIKNIEKELKTQIKKFEKEGKLLEAERIKRRTNYDLAMIREVGYCSGIENYSRHLSGKLEGEAPETLLSYFPHKKLRNQEHSLQDSHSILEGQVDSVRSEYPSENVPDFLTIIDESHQTLPQIRGMFAGDKSRKTTLVEYGFRLPSAKDNRPLRYEEFESRIGEVVYVSATPGDEEREKSEKIVEQIIRPTGLLDPEILIKPVTADKEKLGQIQDFIKETEITIKRGFRVLATTLTKKMAEDLTNYLKDKKIKAEYLHSDVKTLDRIKIITEFRKGKFDVLVGVNLLREGLDLPEVALIGILDADKEGFLRSETALIQIIGRAARNSEGRVILYADRITDSLERAIKETTRRRNIQIAYNKKHGITPKTILKNIKDITEDMESGHSRAVNAELDLDLELFKTAYKKELKKDGSKITREKGKIEVKLKMSDDERKDLVYEKIIKIKEREMNKAVKELDFETAAILRDEIGVLRERMPARNAKA